MVLRLNPESCRRQIYHAGRGFGSKTGISLDGRAGYESISKFITYILTSNIPEQIPYVTCAQGAGRRKTVASHHSASTPAADERLLSGVLPARAYLFLGSLEALGAMATFVVLHGFGWHYGEMLALGDPRYLQATSACLMAIVLTQTVNLFACRHPRLQACLFPLFANRWLLGGLASEIGLLLVIFYTPWGNGLLGTAPLLAVAFFYAFLFALLLGAAEEARKWLIRRGWAALPSSHSGGSALPLLGRGEYAC